MLKIYEQDHGWAGTLIVVSESEEKARRLMEEHPTYDKTQHVNVYEIVEGLEFANYGDF